MKKIAILTICILACAVVGVFLGSLETKIAPSDIGNESVACGQSCLRIAANLYGVPCDSVNVWDICPLELLSNQEHVRKRPINVHSDLKKSTLEGGLHEKNRRIPPFDESPPNLYNAGIVLGVVSANSISKEIAMMKLSWVIVMVLVVFNAVFIPMSFNTLDGIRGKGCKADGCSDGVVEYNECAHFAENDPCQSVYCIKNLEYFPKCPSDIENNNDCPVVYSNTALRNRTYFRFAENCQSGNSTTWNRHEFTNPCWHGLAYETRCESGGCTGTEVPNYATIPVLGRYVCQ